MKQTQHLHAERIRKNDTYSVTLKQCREGKMRQSGDFKSCGGGKGKYWTWLRRIRNKGVGRKVWTEDVCRNIRLHESKCV